MMANVVVSFLYLFVFIVLLLGMAVYYRHPLIHRHERSQEQLFIEG